MSEYTEQVKALLSASTVSTAWGKMMQDAAVAIEALQEKVNQAEKRKMELLERNEELELKIDMLTADCTNYEIAIDELKAAQPHWVSVEEPPKDSKPVICWEKQGFPYVDRYFPKHGWELANIVLAESIYWMPIEPPREENK